MASRSDNLPRRFAKIYTAAITDVLDEMGLLRQTLPHREYFNSILVLLERGHQGRRRGRRYAKDIVFDVTPTG